MLKALLRRHRGLAVAASLLGGLALVAGTAGPAYAAGSDTGPSGGNNASGNYIIYTGGSNTTYLMMQGLAALFNESPGCDLASASGTTQPLDYGCPGINDAGGSLTATNNPANTTDVGENGFTVFSQENPFNDILINEPAIGSSNGIKELEEQNTHVPADPTVTVGDVLVTASSAVITAAGSPFPAALCSGTWTITGPDQEIPSSTTVATPCSTTSITMSNAAASGAVTGHYSVTFSLSASGNNVAPLDVARSSRAPNLGASGDDQGLNFVAYAMDGVSWIHWTEVNGVPTPSAGVTNLSVADLTAIWSDQSCTGPGGFSSPTPNWECYGGTTSAPIDVYWAQSGSGTESTWATLTGLSGPQAFVGLAANHIIFENETASILANDGVTNEGATNAIFFFSFGKFNTTCTPALGYCGAAPTTPFTGTTTLALGQVAGSTVNEASIASQLPGGTTSFNVSAAVLASGTKAAKVTSPASFPANVFAGDAITDSANCIPASTTVALVKSATKIKLSNKTTCASASDTLTFTPPAPFPGDRLLYNIYSDGSNTNIAPSSLASLNAVSEDGFMCKPSTAADVDPNTGATYRSEIDSVITSQGFFPLPLEVETGAYTSPANSSIHYGAASLANPAWTLPAVSSGPETGGLNGSGYAASNETAAPYDFPVGNTDTDTSAVAGSYTVGQPPAMTAATPTAPIGYCLVLSTDGAPQPS
jgi:hypothetical protein